MRPAAGATRSIQMGEKRQFLRPWVRSRIFPWSSAFGAEGAMVLCNIALLL